MNARDVVAKTSVVSRRAVGPAQVHVDRGRFWLRKADSSTDAVGRRASAARALDEFEICRTLCDVRAGDAAWVDARRRGRAEMPPVGPGVARALQDEQSRKSSKTVSVSPRRCRARYNAGLAFALVPDAEAAGHLGCGSMLASLSPLASQDACARGVAFI